VEAVGLALRLLGQSEARKAKPADVRGWAEKAVKSAGLYGKVWQREIMLAVGQVLRRGEGLRGHRRAVARRAERLLDSKEPPAAQKKVLDTLADVAGQGRQGQGVQGGQARIAKLDFRIKTKTFPAVRQKATARCWWSCSPAPSACRALAADLAYDALGKTYKPARWCCLQYHLHIPRPTPLTSPDSIARQKFLTRTAVRATPTILFKRQAGRGGGGSREDAPEKYDEYREVIDPLLEKDAGAAIKLSANRKGSKVTIDVGRQQTFRDGRRHPPAPRPVRAGSRLQGQERPDPAPPRRRSMPGGEAGAALDKKTFKKSYSRGRGRSEEEARGVTLKKYNEDNPFPTSRARWT